jgi:hypothetical protein
MMIRYAVAKAATSRARGPARGRACRGIALIEAVVLMTGVATMLGLCAISIQLLIRLNSDGQARLNTSVALERLASEFRSDVHSCETARIGGSDGASPGPASSPSLQITLRPGHVVSYEARPTGVVRLETDAGKSRRESYILARKSVVSFERRDIGPRHFVAMVVRPAAGTDALAPPRPIEVLACEGKDRFRGTPGEGRAER